jgi:hypothetical protein
MDGKGLFKWEDGRRYLGEFKGDLRHGSGEFRWPDGRVFKGFWKGGVMDGEGVFLEKEGKEKKVVKGKWLDGKKVE